PSVPEPLDSAPHQTNTRRGVDVSEKTYNGQDWATHTMSLLLSNTYSLYFTAREMSQQDSTGETLGEWVSEGLWGDLKGMAATEKRSEERRVGKEGRSGGRP